MKNSKFNPLFETIYSRFQNGAGFLAGDVVKLKSNYKNLECYKNLGENVKQRIEDIVKTGNNIRVGRLHNSHFSNSYGAFGGTDAPATLADCYEEVAPSFWRNLVTVPVECLETNNPALDLPPVPEGQKDKQRAYQKPLEVAKDKPNKGAEIDEQTKVGKKQTHAQKGDYKLATDNTKLDHANKYNDEKPSKAEGQKEVKELKENVEDVYARMLTEDVGMMGSGANLEEEGETAFSPRARGWTSLPSPEELEQMDDESIRSTLRNAKKDIKALDNYLIGISKTHPQLLYRIRDMTNPRFKSSKGVDLTSMEEDKNVDVKAKNAAFLAAKNAQDRAQVANKNKDEKAAQAANKKHTSTHGVDLTSLY